MRKWGQFMMKQGVFARDEIGFGYVTDSPEEAVDLIVRSLPPPFENFCNPQMTARAPVDGPLESRQRRLKMKITIVGAAGGEVTGSAYYVQTKQAACSWIAVCSRAAGNPKP